MSVLCQSYVSPVFSSKMQIMVNLVFLQALRARDQPVPVGPQKQNICKNEQICEKIGLT